MMYVRGHMAAHQDAGYLRGLAAHQDAGLPYATGVNVSAEAVLTQVEQLVCFHQLDIRTGWPTRVELPGALPCWMLNLSERRSSTHINFVPLLTKSGRGLNSPLNVLYE